MNYLMLLVMTFCFMASAIRVPMDIVDFEFTTISDTETTIYTEAIPDNEVWEIKVVCVAKKQDKTAREGFDKELTLYRKDGGDATIEGSVTVLHEQSGVPFTLTLETSGANFLVKAKGVPATNVRWDGCKRIILSRQRE